MATSDTGSVTVADAAASDASDWGIPHRLNETCVAALGGSSDDQSKVMDLVRGTAIQQSADTDTESILKKNHWRKRDIKLCW
jgi:hypothetical protein